MWQNSDFTKHGSITIANKLLELVNNHDWSLPHLWNPADKNFKGTQCIYYNFSPVSQHLYVRNYNNADLLLRAETQYIIDHILTLFPGYRFIKGEISHCPAGERQGFHIDPRVFHRLSHRVHIPLITNPQSSLIVINNKQHLSQGEIWTFNNLKMHASENLGVTSRVHIVVDIMEQEIFDNITARHSELYLYNKVEDHVIRI